jgi:cellulose biosynthesis protein BcsQ
MAHISCFTVQKGGAGKTSVTVNVAGALAGAFGLRTLVIDADPQCNATSALLGPDYIDPAYAPTFADVLEGRATIQEAAVQRSFPTLWTLPGSERLVAYEMGRDDPKRGQVIHSVASLLTDAIPDDIDVVLIDTPPSGGIWLQIALAAAHTYQVVATPDDFSASGVLKLIGTVDQVCADFNPGLRRGGFVINQVRRTSEADQYVRFFRECFEHDVFRTIFPLRGVIGSSRGARMPVELYERRWRASTPAAPLFRDVAAEWMERVGIEGRGPVQWVDGETRGIGAPAPVEVAA